MTAKTLEEKVKAMEGLTQWGNCGGWVKKDDVLALIKADSAERMEREKELITKMDYAVSRLAHDRVAHREAEEDPNLPLTCIKCELSEIVGRFAKLEAASKESF